MAGCICDVLRAGELLLPSESSQEQAVFTVGLLLYREGQVPKNSTAQPPPSGRAWNPTDLGKL